MPVASTTVKKGARTSGTAPPGPASSGNVSGGTKRKAEDQLPRPSRSDGQAPGKLAASRPAAPSGTPKTVPKPASAMNLKPESSKPVPKNGMAAVTKAAPTKTAPAKAAPPKPAPAPSKPPPKGSYAEIMARAKALQDKAPAQVGMLRHQAVPKERLSKVERKRRMMEAKAQEKAARRSGKQIGPGLVSKGKPAVKKPEPDVPSYKGTAKPAKVPEVPAYRGTAGLPASRGVNDRRASGKRRDEYLGTDEEDEGDYGGYDDFYSDVSSDMEAGFDDVEEEEGVALKSARKEDEEEARREMAAKKEKMERQRKLAALASRTKR